MGYCNNYSLFSFIGLPGCGKSTLGSLLALKYKLEYFETSFLIDKAIAEAKEKSKMIFEKMDYEAEKQERRKKRGENCENEFVCSFVSSFSICTILCSCCFMAFSYKLYFEISILPLKL